MATMMNLTHDLPPGALIGGAAQALANAMTRAGGLWLRADPDELEADEILAVTGWRARVGGITALPTAANTGNSRYSGQSPLPGLQFRAERHCGFAVPGVVADARALTLAVNFAGPRGGMRTLATLNLPHLRNYLFLMESDDQIIFKMQDNSAVATLPARVDPTQPALIVAGLSDGRLTLVVNGVRAVSAPMLPPGVSGKADLYIGCRSNRGGLVKTLGEGIISDVLFWPLDITETADPAAVAQWRALDAYRFWSL